MTENKIVGDGGELLKPDTTSEYYDVPANVVQAPIVDSILQRIPWSIVFGALLIIVIALIILLYRGHNSMLDVIQQQTPLVTTKIAIQVGTSQAEAIP